MAKKVKTYLVTTLAKTKAFERYEDILRAIFNKNQKISIEEAKKAIEKHLNREVK